MTPPPRAACSTQLWQLDHHGARCRIGTPLGILAGTDGRVWPNSDLTQVVRFINDILLSAPVDRRGPSSTRSWSRRWGIPGRGAVAVSQSFAIPVVVRTTKTCCCGAHTLREATAVFHPDAARALSLTSATVRHAWLHHGCPAAVARVSGETAPLLFTALKLVFQPRPQRPDGEPAADFEFALSRTEYWQTLAWVGALLITAAVLGLSIFARALSSKNIMTAAESAATFTTPVVTDRPTAPDAHCRTKGLGTRFEFLLRRPPGAEACQRAALCPASSLRSSVRPAAENRPFCGCSIASMTSIRKQRADGEVLLDEENILNPA